MKCTIKNMILLLIFFTPVASYGENNPYWQEPTKVEADSLKQLWLSTENDTLKMYASRQLGLYYQEISRPAALTYFEEQLSLSRQLRQKLWEAEALSRIGYVSGLMQNYSGGLKSLLMAIEIASDPKSERGILNIELFTRTRDPHHARMTVLGPVNEHLGLLYYWAGDYNKAIEYYKKCLIINDLIRDNAFLSLIYMDFGETYIELKQYDMAMSALTNALYYSEKSGYEKYKGLLYYDIGKIYEKALNYGEAKRYYHLGAQASMQQQSTNFVGLAYMRLADLEIKNGSIDSSLIFAAHAMNTFRVMNDSVGLADAYLALSTAFDVNDQMDSAYHYIKEGIALKSALNKEDRVKKFQAVGFQEQIRLQALEAEQIRLQTNIRTFSLLAGITVLLFVSGLLYRNSMLQKRSKAEIEEALTELKATQAQLIQQEKLASLGQLTAGIAHEIKNPLNFVNNFSEVSIELIDEAFNELAKVKTQHAASPQHAGSPLEAIQETETILQDIKSNLSKIHEHGTRANGIVTSMLQHSRGGSGKMEPTDLNALVKEYVNLCFHGMRAGKNPINVDIQLDLDEKPGNVNLISEDFSRVVLNLVNNAFDAMREKTNTNPGYKPVLSISTKQKENAVEIAIADNGPGIPEEIKDKILQPFFTTKKGTEGTGLGLSITNDIVKEHGGELGVKTTEGEGSEFIIRLISG